MRRRGRGEKFKLNTHTHAHTHTHLQTPPSLPRKRKNVQISISDDDLAARGLISVSKSNENLSNLALPIKMQKSLSQEFTLNIGGGRKRGKGGDVIGQWNTHYSPYPVNSSVTDPSGDGASAAGGEAVGGVNGQQEVRCAISGGREVDTQLRPCGCMFMGSCLKKRWREIEEEGGQGEGGGEEGGRGLLGTR